MFIVPIKHKYDETQTDVEYRRVQGKLSPNLKVTGWQEEKEETDWSTASKQKTWGGERHKHYAFSTYSSWAWRSCQSRRRVSQARQDRRESHGGPPSHWQQLPQRWRRAQGERLRSRVGGVRVSMGGLIQKHRAAKEKSRMEWREEETEGIGVEVEIISLWAWRHWRRQVTRSNGRQRRLWRMLIRERPVWGDGNYPIQFKTKITNHKWHWLCLLNTKSCLKTEATCL